MNINIFNDERLNEIVNESIDRNYNLVIGFNARIKYIEFCIYYYTVGYNFKYTRTKSCYNVNELIELIRFELVRLPTNGHWKY